MIYNPLILTVMKTPYPYTGSGGRMAPVNSAYGIPEYVGFTAIVVVVLFALYVRYSIRKDKAKRKHTECD